MLGVRGVSGTGERADKANGVTALGRAMGWTGGGDLRRGGMGHRGCRFAVLESRVVELTVRFDEELEDAPGV